MPKTVNQEQRLPWTTPELRRIDAGSAEAVDNQGNADVGGTGNTQKS